jgi:hypothetical protein
MYLKQFVAKRRRFFINSDRTFKGVFIFIFGVLINSFTFSQQIIFNIGDNIIDYLSKNPAQYLTYGTFIIDYPDGRVDFLKYKAETSEIDTKFLIQGSTVFGVMQYKNKITTLLYDITGDGILDVSHDALILPFWVLSESTYTNISNSNNLSQHMTNGFNIFNSDIGPNAPDGLRNYLIDLSSYMGTSNNNRDLFYGLMQYYIYTQSPSLALMLISELGIRYEKRFGNMHPLILLHTAESLIQLGNREAALIFINDLLSTNPNFIPAKVYSWQLETDPVIKQRKYNELKTNHPNHWIVKQI